MARNYRNKKADEQKISISNNFGDPDCYKCTLERVCKVLRENKIEM